MATLLAGGVTGKGRATPASPPASTASPLSTPSTPRARVDAEVATVDDIPSLQKLNLEHAERKLAMLKDGAACRKHYAPMPSHRSCQDASWLVLFLVMAGGFLAWGADRSAALMKAGAWANGLVADGVPALLEDLGVHLPAKGLLITLAVAFCSSMIACAALIVMAHKAPSCVVWSSLIVGPCLLMVLGLGLLGISADAGLMLLVVGALSFCVCFCCYRHHIPFMAEVTHVVADVIEEHPCMMTVSLIGTSIAFVWAVAMGLAYAAIVCDWADRLKQEDPGPISKLERACFLGSLVTFFWGLGIASNLSHVTYCGVFGHWYYKAKAAGSDSDDSEDSDDADAGCALMPAMGVAFTTSLGSICFGSLFVAIFKALELLTRRVRRSASQSWNPIVCVLGCCCSVIVESLGGLLEYFNDWAYVQCAVRGVPFMDATRITFSLIMCANMESVQAALLLNFVFWFGAVGVAAIGALATALVAAALYGAGAAAVGASVGFAIGLVAGAGALGIVNSGVKALLVCWADSPDRLRETHPEFHEALMQKTLAMQ